MGFVNEWGLVSNTSFHFGTEAGVIFHLCGIVDLVASSGVFEPVSQCSKLQCHFCGSFDRDCQAFPGWSYVCGPWV